MENTFYGQSLFSYPPPPRVQPLLASREIIEGRRTSDLSTSALNLTPENVNQRRISERKLVLALYHDITRDRAIQHLAKNREIHEELGPILCNSSGTLTIIVQEIVSISYRFYTSEPTEEMATRVCHALTLLHVIIWDLYLVCVALHPDTKMEIIRADLLRCIYPFLESTNKGKCHEYLRLSSLGVIAALVKVENAEVISFLLKRNIFSPCLICMEVGAESSKLVATFIVKKILMTDEGLKHCCQIVHRYVDLDNHFRQMVVDLAKQQQPLQELLKCVLQCYIRFSENPRAIHDLRLRPDILNKLKDATLKCTLQDDPNTVYWLKQLFYNVFNGSSQGATS